MNDYEEKKYSTIEKIEKGIITRKEGSFELNLSLKQIDRLRKIYREEGKEGFIHKNRGKVSNKKIDEKIIDELKSLYLNEYYDYNLIAFYEELCESKKYKDKYNISYSSLYNMFLKDDIVSPLAHKETVKLYNERMNKSISENKPVNEEIIELYQSRKIAFEQAHTRKSNNMFAFGQEVQMDACEKIWFGNVVTYLHLAVDKATKKVLYGYFDYEETTQAYLTVLMNMILCYGIPNKIKTDKRNSFSVNNARSSKTKLNLTQFGRICEDLEITLSSSSDPLFKPNVERENGTFKRRLKAELRHENITTIDEANKYLNNVFIPKMNKRFSCDINPNKNMMKPNNYSINELNILISIRIERTIDNASSVKYFNHYYLPINDETGEVMSFKSGTKCNVVNSYDNKLYGIINDNIYSLLLVEQQENSNNQSASKNGYKSNKNNPWRRFKIN